MQSVKNASSGAVTVLGYVAGVVTGVTYGLNPLFAVPLMRQGMSVDTILFFRYFLAVVILGLWLLIRKENFRISLKQGSRLVILGLLFSMSSLTLFEAYNYIASGIATTIVFLYPVLVALIMVFMRVYPTWQVWLAIVLTFVGVAFLCSPESGQAVQFKGIFLAFASALSYSMFIVVINRSTSVRPLSNSVLTFYALVAGMTVFLVHALVKGSDMAFGLDSAMNWVNLTGLAVMPTVISTATLAMATRIIGATKASVLGVFEPVTAILVGALAFGEKITFNVIIGIIIAMAAVTFMIVSSPKSR